MSIQSDAQKASPGVLVELVELDAMNLDGGVHRFVRGQIDSAPVSFGGNVYAPLAFETSGWERTGDGPFPEPILRVSNINATFTALCLQYGGLIGARLTRLRTFKDYLDGQPKADSNAYFAPDIFVVDQVRKRTKGEIEWQLAAACDQPGVRLPGRQILRDTCTHSYRVWDASAGEFDYTAATCPYTGEDCFDSAGAACDPAEDYCGRRHSDCIKRFGEAPLPTRAFAGVTKGS